MDRQGMGVRPNILLITTDQQRHDHLGLAGVQGVDTPHLDRLGNEGMHLCRAYCPSPLCTPARVSMLTGRYPSSHGAYSIGVTADPFPGPTVADLLRDAGYATALIGKTHFVRRAEEESHMLGRTVRSSEDFRRFGGPYLGFEHVRASKAHNIDGEPAMHYQLFLEDAGVDYRPWYPKLHGEKHGRRCGAWEIPAELHPTAWVAAETEQFIRHQSMGSPWFCWASIEDPHAPFVCPEPWYSNVRAQDLAPYPGPYPGEFDDKPPFYRWLHENREAGWNEQWQSLMDDVGVPCVFPEPAWDAQWQAALQATLGMIAFIDDRVGSILHTLQETGQAENTLVIFTSDHGEMHGHHGLWGKGLTAYEDCQRVPMLAWGPGLVPTTGRTDALVNLVDLPSTFLSLADVPIPAGWHGADMAPLLTGRTDRVQDETLIELRATEASVYQHTMVTDRHKLVVYRDQDWGELYDLAADPDQLRNLWTEPGHAALRGELLLRMNQAQLRRQRHVAPRRSFA